MKTRETECATVEILVKGPGKVVPATASELHILRGCSSAKRKNKLLRLFHSLALRKYSDVSEPSSVSVLT